MTAGGFDEAESPRSVRPLDLSGRERQVRAAMTAMERIGIAFARYARRSLPFLARHHARIVPMLVELVPTMAGSQSSEGGPRFSVLLGSEDATARASVTLGPDAVALVLEGALGGGGQLPAAPLAAELTPAQRALLTRVGRSLALDLATAIREESKLVLVPLSADAQPPSGNHDSLKLPCHIEGMQAPAVIEIATNAEALEAAARQQGQSGEQTPTDPRLAEALREVPLEVVAELGSIAVGLRRILAWRVGDVVRLRTATDESVAVLVGGVKKFEGAPILSRGQLAIEIRQRHER
jgi:flagellar motor switch protein FliM